jgi:predicted HNH restriction endonuclease
MSRKSTAEQVATAQEKRKQADQELKQLLKKQREEERIKRDKRHTERGAIAERLLDGKAELTDKEFQKKIEELLKVYNRQNKVVKTDEPPANKAETSESENGA